MGTLPSAGICAQSVLTLKSPQGKFNYAPYVKIYEDKTSKLYIKEILELKDNQFLNNNSNEINLGTSESAFWLKLDFYAHFSDTLILTVGGPTAEDIQVYNYKNDQQTQYYVVGANYPFYQRPIIAGGFNTPLRIEPGLNTVFIRYQGRYQLVNPYPFISTRYAFDTLEKSVLPIFNMYFGFLICMIAFNIILYKYAGKDVSYIFYLIYLIGWWLNLFALVGYGSMYFWPDTPLIQYYAQPITLAVCILGFLFFSMRFLQLKELLPKAHFFYKTISILLGILLVLSFSDIAHEAYKGISVLTVITVLSAPFFGYKVYKKGLIAAKYFVLAFSILFLSTFALIPNAIFKAYMDSMIALYSILIGSSIEVLMITLALFEKYSLERKAMQERLEVKNQAASRFVPESFLNYLNRSSIEEVQLGDQRMANLIVMFVDIRSYTTLTENMSPEDNTRFINAYFRGMIPCIENRNGIIDKFIGDCIMALFFDPHDALAACDAIKKELVVYNRERKKRGFKPIENGIGMHAGEVMMATVGNEKRLSTTVYSDAVNTAARLETLTKEIGTKILVSDSIVKMFSESERQMLEMQFLGTTIVKGKTDPVGIYEYFGYLSEEQKQSKKDYKDKVQTAVALMEEGDPKKAQKILSPLVAEHPNDQVIFNLHQKVNKLIAA